MMLGPYAWLVKWVAISLVIIGLAAAVKVQTARLDAAKAEYSAYRAKVEALGMEAEKARQKDILDRAAISKKQESDNAKRIASLDLRYRAAVATAKLSSAVADSGEAKPLSSAASELSCPDRQADIARWLAELETGVLGLIERGDKAIERTITCKAWLDEQAAK